MAFELERIDKKFWKGYRFRDDHYAFYDVFYQKVSGHYVVLEQSRYRQYRWGRGVQPKPVMGPYILEVLEPEAGEGRCRQEMHGNSQRKDVS